MKTTRIARLERLATALIAHDDTERADRVYDALDREVARTGSARARAERDRFTDALDLARWEARVTHTAIASPVVVDWADSSGDYALMLTPGGTGFWMDTDGIKPIAWRDVTDAEQDALHYGATDDDATRYSFDTLVFGPVEDYGIAGDMIAAGPRFARAVLVTIDYGKD